MAAATPRRGWRWQVHLWFDHGAGDDLVATVIHRALVVLICANVLAIVLESVPTLAARFGPGFELLERISLAVFTVEYVIRIWIAPEHARYRGLSATRARLAYLRSFPAIIDLLDDPVGAAYVRNPETGQFEPCEDEDSDR